MRRTTLRHPLWQALLCAALTLAPLGGLRGLRAGEAAELPDPATGGPDGKPISLLVIGERKPLIEAEYAESLTAAGYRVKAIGFADHRLTPEYLRHWSVVILAGLPGRAATYGVGWQYALNLEPNMRALREHVAAGGGLFFQQDLTGGGKGRVQAYNHFLEEYGASFLPQLVRDPGRTRRDFAPGRIRGKAHPVAAGLEHLLYPDTVLRWDDAYSAVPVMTGEAWSVLATAGTGAGTYVAKNNSQVYDTRLGDERQLLALREYRGGTVAVSGIHRYYTLTHVHHAKEAVGENATGVIAGRALYGEEGAGGRPSQLGTLIERILRYMGGRAAARGIGGGTEEDPTATPTPPSELVIDWSTRQPPPTWAHRVIPDLSRGWQERTYDEHPDPLITGPVQHYKALIGPRTALSSGKGTVREYREAALAAGYSAVFFAEEFHATTPENFRYLVRDCRANSDEELVCVPGLEIEDTQGERYIILGAERWPEAILLTPDGRYLADPGRLSLGWGARKLATAHRPGRGGIHPQLLKHYEGITIATYDGEGRQVDDGLYAYHWAVAADSNPLPITVHELESPAQVATAAETGFQQIMPADDLREAVEYFLHAHAHYFECPVRYYISEGPVLDGWSIFNKDIGKAEYNRDKYRLGVGLTSDAPLAEVELYRGLELVRRWSPREDSFRALLDYHHSGQHLYLLMARDARGRRVISPQIRTVTTNYIGRCADRQNWLGPIPRYALYAGWHRPPAALRFTFRHHEESHRPYDAVAPIYDFPLVTNQLYLIDTSLNQRFINAEGKKIYGDSSPAWAVRPTDLTRRSTRTQHLNPIKRKDFAVMLVETRGRLRRTLQPELRGRLWPTVTRARRGENRLILPGAEPQTLAQVEKGSAYDPTPENAYVAELPVGSYVGGVVVLSEGLALENRAIGFPAPPPATPVSPAREWRARLLLLQPNSWKWRAKKAAGPPIDERAEEALRQMGFRGERPYGLALDRGELLDHAYVATLQAAEGAVAGRCENPEKTELLYYVPLHIRGLRRTCEAALWREGADHLVWFDTLDGVGYVAFDADRSGDFWAGNVARCDPLLHVEAVAWSAEEAWFRLHNPTGGEITTAFATAEVPGFRRLVREEITVPAGGSVAVKSD
jgi:hypothetical protein